MTADMEANEKLSPTVTELFLRGRRLNIALVSQNIRPNTRHYFTIKILNKRKLQQIASNHLLILRLKVS